MDYLKQVWNEFREDNAMLYAAGVAFFAALSLAPMVLLFIAITSVLGFSVREKMIDTVTNTVGPNAGDIVRSIAEAGSDTFAGGANLSMAVSIAVILFSASSVVATLQLGLNRIWDVKAAPDAGWFNWVRKRLLSIAMVLGISFLLLTSMVLTTIIEMLMPSTGWAWNLATLAVSFSVFVLLFAAMFRILPDVTIAWRDVWLGAIVTSLLFAVGKYGLGLYLAHAGFENKYGGAGSLVAMLVWVYYSTIIVYLGAEITQVHARRSGRPITPDKHAVAFEEVTVDAAPTGAHAS